MVVQEKIPGDLAKHFDALIEAKRASGELDDVEAARKSGTLTELLKSGKLTPADLDKLTPEELSNFTGLLSKETSTV